MEIKRYKPAFLRRERYFDKFNMVEAKSLEVHLPSCVKTQQSVSNPYMAGWWPLSSQLLLNKIMTYSYGIASAYYISRSMTSLYNVKSRKNQIPAKLRRSIQEFIQHTLSNINLHYQSKHTQESLKFQGFFTPFLTMYYNLQVQIPSVELAGGTLSKPGFLVTFPKANPFGSSFL